MHRKVTATKAAAVFMEFSSRRYRSLTHPWTPGHRRGSRIPSNRHPARDGSSADGFGWERRTGPEPSPEEDVGTPRGSSRPQGGLHRFLERRQIGAAHDADAES